MLTYAIKAMPSNEKKRKKKIHFPLAMGGKKAIMTHAHDGRTGNHNLPNI